MITLPIWLVILGVVALVLLALIAAFSTLAWFGTQAELEDLRMSTKVLQIDLHASAFAPRPPRSRWSSADRERIEDDRSGRGF